MVEGRGPLGGELIEFKTEAAWKAAHNSPDVVTGTEAGAICGVNKYLSRYELWLIKTGNLVSTFDAKQSPAARAGSRLEPVILEMFKEDTGLHVHEDPRWSMRRDQTTVWRYGSVDGHVWDPEIGEWGIWECKTASAYLADQWKDKIPLSYLIQVVHYWLITDYSFAIFSTLIGGQVLQHKKIHRDERLCELVTQAEAQFMEMVRHDSPPPIDGHPSVAGAISRRFPISIDEKAVTVGDEGLEWDRLRMEAIATGKKALLQREAAENNIKAAIGDASYGLLSDGTRYSWRGAKGRRLQRLKTKLQEGEKDEQPE